ncbi:hypothetical protein VNO78_03854 [Psophocarpus tetragonolobus]|uniref:Uncharacterized protein n=1 Tax=Psophocarpus tetragonolobus TaxID=3891 RepID=A0AAN9XX29_PSOTE
MRNFGIAKRGCDPKGKRPSFSLHSLSFFLGGVLFFYFMFWVGTGNWEGKGCVFWGSIKGSFQRDLSWSEIKKREHCFASTLG